MSWVFGVAAGAKKQRLGAGRGSQPGGILHLSKVIKSNAFFTKVPKANPNVTRFKRKKMGFVKHSSASKSVPAYWPPPPEAPPAPANVDPPPRFFLLLPFLTLACCCAGAPIAPSSSPLATSPAWVGDPAPGWFPIGRCWFGGE